MAKFPLYQWKKATGNSTTVDTTNLAKLNTDNTFAGVNTFSGVVNLNGGFTVPNTADANAAKDITNNNDNQLANYKAFYWKQLHEQGSLTLTANGGIQAYDVTVSNDLVAKRHVKIMVRFTPNSYDYTLTFDLTLNSLTYKNQGEVKMVHWGNNTESLLDPTKFVFVTVAQYSSNKLRVIIRNGLSENITINKTFTYIQMLKPKFQI